MLNLVRWEACVYQRKKNAYENLSALKLKTVFTHTRQTASVRLVSKVKKNVA